MKPIVDYLDYRTYMREFYEERKRSFAFTWREFSRLSGFASSGYLKLVCDGKTRLCKSGAISVAAAMKLTGYQSEYFCHMVEFCDSRDGEKKRKAYDEMQRLAKANKVRFLGGEAYTYFSNWINPVLRELAPIMPGAKPLEMAHMLCPSVPAADVRFSLDYMVQMGLLEKEEVDGSFVYRQVDVGINPGVDKNQQTALNVAMNALQKQYSRMAADSLDEFSPVERSLSGITMGLDRATYRKIEKELENFRKRVEVIVSNVKEYDRVYRMNLQLFPLSRKQDEK